MFKEASDQVTMRQLGPTYDLDPLFILDEAVQAYNPRHVVALFSGGYDSLVTTHVASQHPCFSFVCHLNTGIGIGQTRPFVRETCREWGIELREYRATECVNAAGQPDPHEADDPGA